MLKQKIFDPGKQYRVALYLRMSSDLQNKRSPDQQRDEIERQLKAQQYKWSIVAVYRDDAKSGRLLRGRRGYQRMLCDIRSGELVVDLILVDTLERFGRVDELPMIRKLLYEEHGVLVLTADTSFTDPTSTAGRALGFVETVRATEHSRVLAHNVNRGKRDAIALKHWPGGAPPFGFKLESVMKIEHGRQEVDHCVLIRNPATDWIIALLFENAAKTNWGTTRLANFLNAQASIPDNYKPFQPESVGYWLDHEIYYGEMVYPKYATGIVADRRVREPCPIEEITRISDFCEPIVHRELWEEVHRLRQIRRERCAAATTHGAARAEKQIVPPAPGMTLKYLLSGLLFCGECGVRMVATPSNPYTTKSGTIKRYTVFACPGAKVGHCGNKTTVPEGWIREVAVKTLCDRLFPGAASNEQTIPSWLSELKELVQAELKRLGDLQKDQQPNLEAELADLRHKTEGWIMSLANKELDATVRRQIESASAEVEQRKQEIEDTLRRRKNRDQRAASGIDESAILEHLQRLSDVLAKYGPTRGNLELSLHIDRIVCYADRRVVMRTCKLGLLPEVADLLADGQVKTVVPLLSDTERIDASNGKRRNGPRRRGRLRVSELADNDGFRAREIADFVADTDRFGNFSDEWFWTDVFEIPVRRAWVEENAQAVLRRQTELKEITGKKPILNVLAREFNVSRPTISTALDLATGKRPTRQERRPEKRNFTMPLDEEKRREIVRLYDETPLTLKQIGKRCGVHRSTVERILNARDKQRGTKRVDGRTRLRQKSPADGR